ncbi:MAG: TRZ/ATZ family hydrolase [Gammaproteobacteria bacterium]|nr:TRZ/ATZ family hydrolase [Gammaproteobacteria bacterium]
MKTVDKVICPKWLIPVDSNESVFEGHAIAVDNGQILAIDTLAGIQSQYHASEFVELPNHALIPGFVNAHTHGAMTLLRGYADDLPLMEWLTDYIWPAEQKWVGDEFMEVGSDLALAEMIRGGTTCFNDMYFFPDIVARRAEQAKMRAMVGMIVIDFPTIWAENSDEYISKGLAVRDSMRHSTLINTAFAPHAPYTVSDDPLQRIATLSGELECPVHIHVHETAHEVDESVARYGMRPIERLDQFNLLNSNLIAVHMTQLLPAEIKVIAERGVNVVHCPESNLKLASGFCPIEKLLKAGVNVAIGTDGASSNNDLDMVGELRTASLLSKGVSGDPSSFNAHKSLEAATLCGAKALGLDHITGSIEIGKMADLTAIDLSDCATQPVYHPVSQIVYSSTRDQVSDVWVAGKRLLDNQNLTTIDKEKTLTLAKELGDKIKR